MSAETVEETSNRCYLYKESYAIIDSDLKNSRKSTVLWPFQSEYHNTRYVAVFPGNHYCYYTERRYADMIDQPRVMIYVKD